MLMFTIVILVFAFSLRKPFIGVCAILATLILRDTMIEETYEAFVQFHCYQILYVGVILGVLISRPDAMGAMVPASAVDWGMLAFLGMLVGSAVVNGVPVLGHKYIDLFTKALVLYFLVSRLADTPRRVRIVGVIIVVCMTYLVYLAAKKYRAGDLSYARPYGRSDIHEFGLELSITLPLIGTMLSDRWPRIVKAMLFMCIPLYVLVTLRTTSRSAYLGVGAGLLMLAWYHRRRLHWCLLAVPLVLFAVVRQREEVTVRLESIWTHRLETGEKDTSIQMRLEQMRTAVRVIQSNPIFGIGPRQFFMKYTEYVDQNDFLGGTYTMHSVPLLILCEEGIIGFAVFYGLIVLGALRDASYVLHATMDDPKMHSVRCVAIGCLMGFIGFLTYGLAQPQMWIATIYAIVGMVTASRRVVTLHLYEESLATQGGSVPGTVAGTHTTQLVFS
jgi:hypothetical protein